MRRAESKREGEPGFFFPSSAVRLHVTIPKISFPSATLGVSVTLRFMLVSGSSAVVRGEAVLPFHELFSPLFSLCTQPCEQPGKRLAAGRSLRR